MTVLVENTSSESPSHVKKASLLAIGYICETADPSNSGVVSQAGGILTAIVQGARTEETDIGVRLTAINALVNSLEFIQENFQKEGERNYIMQVVCEATQAENVNLQAAAFGAMARIMNLYYPFMALYMEKAMFGLTVNGMKSSDETVACMAVEFWSTVCEEEIGIDLNLAAMAESDFQEVSEQNFHFAYYALSEVLPTLLNLLTKQEEEADDDEWNISMAAGSCLQLYAQNTRSAIVGPTVKFVEQNIGSSKWNEREAAVMAFGSILDGPETEEVNGLIDQALPSLLKLMSDEYLQVRDTVAWCLGKMAYIEDINFERSLEPIMHALSRGLGDHPKVAVNCCWTVMNLTENLNQDGPQAKASAMSPYYSAFVPALLQLASSAENWHSCRTSAFEALSTMVTLSSQDVMEIVRSLSTEVLQRLHATIVMQQQVLAVEDKANVEDVQVNLLALLTSIIRRFGKDILPAANELMELYLTLLQSKFPNSLIEEDIFISIGAVAGAINDNFEVYMEALLPFIYSVLKDTQSHTCITTIGLISDISHALGPKIEKYSETFMKILGELLQDTETPREVKRTILSSFGDIASSMGPSFSFFLPVVMQVTSEASSVQTDVESSMEFVDYVSRLRESITDAYVGIVTGLRDVPNDLLPYVKTIITFLSVIKTDENMIRSEATVRSVVGLLGDIASMYPPGQLKEFYQQDWITELVRKARSDSEYSPATTDTARWTREQQKIQLSG